MSEQCYEYISPGGISMIQFPISKPREYAQWTGLACPGIIKNSPADTFHIVLLDCASKAEALVGHKYIPLRCYVTISQGSVKPLGLH